ncbi:hypothetical protein [Streptomyces sp. S465]|uniref:hypothetical protein n=1 Tax=Streptomyces sp. S465 TaxID=2979468 RepID=UPI0022A8535E|nr:hypothetical protein [Streptomyces sp. S465]WAP59132.1 hypothetical protein N6H00_31560 [Streptomyces sp. S465]
MPTTTNTTNTGNTTTTTNQPDPAQLSGATAAVWAALNNQPGTTSTALAQVAGVGRSTTTIPRSLQSPPHPRTTHQNTATLMKTGSGVLRANPRRE